jgi:hypothetical protein
MLTPKIVAKFLTTIGLIFFVSLFLPALAFANTASIYSNNSTPAADGNTVAVITIDVNDGSGNAVGSGDQITITNTNSDSGLKIIANNNGSCNGASTATSLSAATGSDGSGTPGNEVQFGVCSTSAQTDNFDVTDSSGDLGTISINFQATSVTPTPTPTPTPTDSTTCTGVVPGGTPQLSSAVANNDNQITLTWTDAADPVSNYLIAYGLESGKYVYGNSNVGGQGTTTYTVGSLAAGTTYYFVVAANNDCNLGSYSNEVSATTTGGAASSNSQNSASSNSDSNTTSSVQGTNTSTPTDTPTPTPTIAQMPPPTAGGSTGISNKEIAVGIAVVIVVILGGIWYWSRRGKNRRGTQPMQPQQPQFVDTPPTDFKI